jgi:acyl transferase domain-containing protein/acyl carrier protein
MDSILPEFCEEVSKVKFSRPSIRLISNLTGAAFSDNDVIDEKYWCRHLRESVQFDQGMRVIDAMGCSIFLELGPAPTLINLGRKCAQSAGSCWLPSLRKGQDDRETIAHALAELYVRGAEVDWHAGCRGQRKLQIALPCYPFERERFWLDLAPSRPTAPLPATPRPGSHPLLGSRLRSALRTIQFESAFDQSSLPFLCDHKIEESIVFPATGYLEIALAAAVELAGAICAGLEDLRFHEALSLPAGGGWRFQTALEPIAAPGDKDANSWMIQIHGQPARDDSSLAEWKLFSSAQLRCRRASDAAAGSNGSASQTDKLDVDTIRNRCSRQLDVKALYSRLAAAGLTYGPSFQGVSRVLIGFREALGEVEVPQSIATEAKAYQFHPAILDACLQVLAAAVADDLEFTRSLFLPVGIRRIVHHANRRGTMGSRLLVHAVQGLKLGGSAIAIEGDLRVCDERGSIVMEIEGFRLQRLTRPAAAPLRKHTYQFRWRTQSPAASAAASNRVVAPAGPWLVLGDRRGVGHRLAGLLREHGCLCEIINRVDGCETNGSRDALFADALSGSLDHSLCGASKQPWRNLVHLWSLDNADCTDIDRMLLPRGETWRQVSEALQRNKPGDQKDVWLVTSGVHMINQEPGEVSVDQAVLWGLGRALQQERTSLRTVLVDLDRMATTEEMANELFAEIRRRDHENQIARRDGARWTLRLCRRDSSTEDDLAPATEDVPKPLLIAPDSTFMVVCEAESSALRLIEWLAASGARHLLLVRSRELSVSAEHAIASICREGAEVKLLRVNLAENSAVSRVRTEASAGSRILGGVVYVPAFDESEVEGSLRAARNLHSLLAQASPSWFLLFSAASSLLGRRSNASQAALAALLEAIAHEQRQSGRRVATIHWGFGQWNSSPAEVISPERGEGFATFPADEALRFAARMLVPEGLPTVLVTCDDWRVSLVDKDVQASPLLEELVPTNEPPREEKDAGVQELAKKLRTASPHDRRDIILAYFVDTLVRVTNQDRYRIDCSEPISRLGLDSLMAVELSSAIESAVGISLPLGVLLEDPSIDDLAKRVLSMWDESENCRAVSAAGSSEIPAFLQYS